MCLLLERLKGKLCRQPCRLSIWTSEAETRALSKALPTRWPSIQVAANWSGGRWRADSFLHQDGDRELPWSAGSSSSSVALTETTSTSPRSCPGTLWPSLGNLLATLLCPETSPQQSPFQNQLLAHANSKWIQYIKHHWQYFRLILFEMKWTIASKSFHIFCTVYCVKPYSTLITSLRHPHWGVWGMSSGPRHPPDTFQKSETINDRVRFSNPLATGSKWCGEPGFDWISADQ